MRYNNIHKILYILICCSMIFSGCKSSLNIFSPFYNTNTFVQNSLEQKIKYTDILYSKNPQFNILQIKGIAEIKNAEEQFKVNLNIKILQDSIILVSGTKLGIKFFAFKIMKDSIFVVNYLDEFYMKTSLASSEKIIGFNIDYSIIESILINAFPHIDTAKYQSTLWTNSHENTHKIFLKHISDASLTTYLFSDYVCTNIDISVPQKQSTMRMHYIADQNKRKKIPYKEMFIQSVHQNENMSLHFKVTKTKHRERMRFKYNIPKDFKRYRL